MDSTAAERLIFDSETTLRLIEAVLEDLRLMDEETSGRDTPRRTHHGAGDLEAPVAAPTGRPGARTAI